MSVINPHTSRAPGIILTAGIYNTDHTNHVTNATTLNTDKVETSRAIATGTGLQGGGNLTADRTLSIDFANPVFSAPNCNRLTKSGANLLLSGYNGNSITINGTTYAIPSSGPTLVPTPLTPGTTYFIYAFISASVITLEASTTAHATSTSTGLEIKSGDATRTLVGMARVITGPAWVDTAAQRFVVSYFNRRDIRAQNVFAVDRTTASATVVEMSSTERAEFLTWADTDVLASGTIYGSTTGAAGTAIDAAVGIDGTTLIDGLHIVVAEPVISFNVNLSLPAVGQRLTEGFHFATLLGFVAAGTLTFVGSATVGLRSAVQATIQG